MEIAGFVTITSVPGTKNHQKTIMVQSVRICSSQTDMLPDDLRVRRDGITPARALKPSHKLIYAWQYNIVS